MSHVSGLFTRRGFNIDSIAVGATHKEGEAIITIVLLGSLDDARQFEQQLLKLADVIDVHRLPYHRSLLRELLLIRVMAGAKDRSGIFGIVEVFGGRIAEVSSRDLLIEIHGEPRRLTSFVMMMQEFGIIEIARTGQVALPYVNVDAQPEPPKQPKQPKETKETKETKHPK